MQENSTKKLRTAGLALLIMALALPTAPDVALAEPADDDPTAPVVASVDATGWFTGTPVHADNPYHATSTPPVTPEPTPSAPESTPVTPEPTPSAPAPSQSTTPDRSTTPRKNTRGLPRTGVDGTSGLAAALVLAAGLGVVVSHRRRR